MNEPTDELTVKVSPDYSTIEIGNLNGNTILAYWFGRECYRQGINPYILDLPHKTPDYTLLSHALPIDSVGEIVSRLRKEVP